MSNTSIQAPTIASEGRCCACGGHTKLSHDEQLANVLNARKAIEDAGWAKTSGAVAVLKKAGVPILRFPLAVQDENYAPAHLVNVALAMSGSAVTAEERKGILEDALHGRMDHVAFVDSMRVAAKLSKRGRHRRTPRKEVLAMAENARG